MIPLIIHHIVGPKPTSLITQCLQSWEKLKEIDFEIVIWTDQSLKIFIRDNFPFALDSFLSARNHAEAADIARYLIIYKFGGYYVDWDILLFNYKDFLNLHQSNKNGYLAIDMSNGTLASEYFAARRKESFLLFLVKDIVHTFKRDERDLMPTPQYSGPFRMRAALRRYKPRKNMLTLIDIKEIFEYDYSEIRDAKVYGKNKIMIHFWMHSWLL
jgi:mannosyltransferase OCH1-like enzyme